MITITVSNAEGQEKESVLKTIEAALVSSQDNKYVAVFREGAYTASALDMIPKIVKIFVLE